jgi:LacI family transcriptional regulator
VEEAVAQLGYRPNTVAQSLRRRSTMTLGLVVPDLTKAFFAELAAAVERAALQEGRRLLICSTQFDAVRELEQLQALLDAQVDGIALTPTHDPRAPADLLRGSGVPWVLLHRHANGVDGQVPVVVGADRQAGRTATDHLLGHGHRTIACLTGPEAGSPVHERTAGFRDAVRAALGRVEEDLVLSVGYDHLAEDAYRAMTSLLATRPDVTAVCATTDEHAFGVYRAAAEHGRRIGRTLAVVSVDGTAQTRFLTPALTVVAVPLDEMGRRATAALLPGAGAAARPSVEPLPLSLVVRSSCGCAR